MKRIKDRKVYPALLKRIEIQEKRIKHAGIDAYLNCYAIGYCFAPSEQGILYSNRNNRCSTPLTITELGVNKEPLTDSDRSLFQEEFENHVKLGMHFLNNEGLNIES